MSQEKLTSYGVFVLRVSLGVLALSHGLLKLLVFTPAGAAQFFQSIGYPGVLAYLVMGGEILGGVALISGAFTRLAAALLIPILLGATAQHVGNGWLFSAKGGGWEFPAFWTLALAAQALLGPGAFAVKIPFATGRLGQVATKA